MDSKFWAQRTSPFRFSRQGQAIRVMWSPDPLDYIILNRVQARRMVEDLFDLIWEVEPDSEEKREGWENPTPPVGQAVTAGG